MDAFLRSTALASRYICWAQQAGGAVLCRNRMDVVQLHRFEANALLGVQRQFQTRDERDVLHVVHEVLPEQRVHHHRKFTDSQEKLRGRRRLACAAKNSDQRFRL